MICVIDYKAGNAPSVMHAVERLGYSAKFARTPADLEGASRIILPGVGSARATMDSLRESGLIAALEEKVLKERIPFLGICVGMQILFEHSEEEDTPCLGWLKGKVVKFDPNSVRVPQMGWNRVEFTDGGKAGYFYFVNSYYAVPEDPARNTWGIADYGGKFAAAAVGDRGNVRGVQFHAEKSGEAGLAVLREFLGSEKVCGFAQNLAREARERENAADRERGLPLTLTKRLIACFDIIGGRVTKAVKFQDNIDVAPAESLAESLYNAQIDELIFYDITASSEKRQIDIETVKKVAAKVFIPFTVGGGIANLDDMYSALKAGAEKISVDSMAVRNPAIITEGAKAFGSQCVVLSTQVKRLTNPDKIGSQGKILPSGYEVYIDGARQATGLDALEWIKRGQELGAGEICLNSIDCDGTLAGYDLELMKMAEEAVTIPLIASGGAGKPEHLADLFAQTQAGAAIISSMLYSPRMERNYTPEEIKGHLSGKGIAVRPFWGTPSPKPPA